MTNEDVDFLISIQDLEQPDFDNACLERENKRLKKEIDRLNKNTNEALDFIDQVLQYHLQPFDYKQVDEDINTLIGILRRINDR